MEHNAVILGFIILFIAFIASMWIICSLLKAIYHVLDEILQALLSDD
jgi:hypothetical protein